MRFAVIGIDHRHVYDLIGGLLDAGAECAGYDPATTDPKVAAGIAERFPRIAPVERRRLIEDPAIDLVVTAAVPSDRAAIAVEAMWHGKDVLADKPGLTTFEQLAAVRQTVRETGRIFSICFSERLLTRASTLATQLAMDGAIGEVIHVTGLGPHRLNRALRPAWFFDPVNYGGILVDIASHQIDQFLFYTGCADANVVSSAVGHFGAPDIPAFQDFGDILLRGDKASGYIRVDWFTADGLPTWGDGRLVLLGTKGTIELRKYVDIAGKPGTDHVFLVDGQGTRHFDASGEKISYFERLLADVRERTETAMTQEHVFTVCRLALEAQAAAVVVTGQERNAR
ncbi:MULTISPECIES: Gfo/Idh/MocA family oxidoreductase [unclassified Mesorhizobium]|uniref:Gfo/Idh/MocA family protein n=1 Tax=unclassified Mesorhizobium TaxID=325217 RepID=UPI00112B81E1|nr:MULTISPECIES: Gfo/Idh/MocA family oxidoreductase [unclassified Mesorhizobium]TPK58662.1 Gfo/Idh/MocA family oxidoreductase [Mesorhizobium sp. B2-5-1]TPM55666.1 Gfo/Idh/MocA family oxidoreductase [Mesorhizobium sp. B2-1-9]TPM81782.1 Gfo/Idh/MocA family oxidoreductase [Mesorhizobium sp. B2-1-4]TPN05911.1 Gfo/Idh/MocA family oxidoreductase [Mesorhizobium sp. B2-1-2]TPN69836.1 Gfo/Idh/MocA family oxidoreductase [Mesorhizobium sp. B1-1-1]